MQQFKQKDGSFVACEQNHGRNNGHSNKRLDHFNNKLIFAMPKEIHPSKPFLARIFFYLSCT